MQEMGCPYYNELGKKNSMFHYTVNKLGPVWDIEELVEAGRENNWCPYFGARNLMEFADIIFCPYNYIIDPDIRASVGLFMNKILYLAFDFFVATSNSVFCRFFRCNSI